jgi:hypothetical protein
MGFRGRPDRDGNFCLNDVPTGRYVLEVRLSRETRAHLKIGEKFSQRPVDLGVLQLKP